MTTEKCFCGFTDDRTGTHYRVKDATARANADEALRIAGETLNEVIEQGETLENIDTQLSELRGSHTKLTEDLNATTNKANSADALANDINTRVGNIERFIDNPGGATTPVPLIEMLNNNTNDIEDLKTANNGLDERIGTLEAGGGSGGSAPSYIKHYVQLKNSEYNGILYKEKYYTVFIEFNVVSINKYLTDIKISYLSSDYLYFSSIRNPFISVIKIEVYDKTNEQSVLMFDKFEFTSSGTLILFCLDGTKLGFSLAALNFYSSKGDYSI